ncbi:hypothetical protein, partial [Planotetraspora phitsanulokensis]
ALAVEPHDTDTETPYVDALVEELRTAAEHARAGRAPLTPGLRDRAVTLLEAAADKVADYVHEDVDQCQDCGHEPGLLCDSCGEFTDPGDICDCYAQVFMLARTINRLSSPAKEV